MADKKLEKNMVNSRSCGNNLEDINFSSMPDMYQPSYGLPASTLAATTNASSNLMPQARAQPPPPLPPRQQPQPSINYPTPAYNNYSYPYNSYNPYNSNTYYNNYSTYPGNNSFSQQAETTTRQAFESVESIVRTFSSIAMMLDSTYQAVFNSFRALLGVSDHMHQLKRHFSNIFSSIAVLRVLRFIGRRLRYVHALIRRGSQAASDELLWSESLHTGELSTDNKTSNNNNTKTWPVMLFFAVVMTGPWLLWKLLSSFTKNKLDEQQQWSKGLVGHYVALADHAFEGRQDDELAFKRGSRLIIAPEEFQASSPKGWLLASLDGEKVGLIPRNYVRIVSKQPPLQPIKTVSNNNQPISCESSQTVNVSSSNLQPIKNTKVTYQPIKDEHAVWNSKSDVSRKPLDFGSVLKDEKAAEDTKGSSKAAVKAFQKESEGEEILINACDKDAKT